MLSQLFAGDTLLDDIANDRNRERISQSQHVDDPAVVKVQIGLLIWDASALPEHGADGQYGQETATAVHRFKRDELGVQGEIIDDVGPHTVIRLDEIAAIDEAKREAGFVVVAPPSVTTDDLVNIRAIIENSGGVVLLGLGNLAAVATGGNETLSALQALIGSTLAGIVSPFAPEMPVDIDEETAQLIAAWLRMLEPDYLLRQLNPNRLGADFAEVFDSCVPPVDAVEITS